MLKIFENARRVSSARYSIHKWNSCFNFFKGWQNKDIKPEDVELTIRNDKKSTCCVVVFTATAAVVGLWLLVAWGNVVCSGEIVVCWCRSLGGKGARVAWCRLIACRGHLAVPSRQLSHNQVPVQPIINNMSTFLLVRERTFSPKTTHQAFLQMAAKLL